jgi:hypothetical protein
MSIDGRDKTATLVLNRAGGGILLYALPRPLQGAHSHARAAGSRITRAGSDV